MRATTAAHSSRSPRYLGKIRPRLVAPTWWPERPTRWMPRATLRGLSTWMTRSMAPMSIPSSRLLVATSAGQAAGLELLLDQHALLGGQAAVVGAGDLLLCQLVEPQGQPLGQPAVVDEHDRRAVRAHQVEDGGVHGRPDRARWPLGAGQPSGSWPTGAAGLASSRMSSTGTTTSRSSSLRSPGVDDRHRPRTAPGVLAAQEPGDLGERPLRRRQADALHAPLRRPAPGARG